MNERSPCSFTVSRLLDRFSTVKSIIPKAACWLKVVLIQTSALSHNLVLLAAEITHHDGGGKEKKFKADISNLKEFISRDLNSPHSTPRFLGSFSL